MPLAFLSNQRIGAFLAPVLTTLDVHQATHLSVVQMVQLAQPVFEVSQYTPID
jgi:hypothetical protein